MAELKIVTSSNSEDFEEKVNAFLNKGWLLINCNSLLSENQTIVFHGFLKKTDPRSGSSFRGNSRGFSRDRSNYRDKKFKDDSSDDRRERRSRDFKGKGKERGFKRNSDSDGKEGGKKSFKGKRNPRKPSKVKYDD